MQFEKKKYFPWKSEIKVDTCDLTRLEFAFKEYTFSIKF